MDIPDENGCTPLMYAAIADSWPAAEMLLNFSAKREMVDIITKGAKRGGKEDKRGRGKMRGKMGGKGMGREDGW